MLKYWIYSHPKFDHSKLDTFGHQTLYPGLIFSLNSPIIGMFKKGASVLGERGTEDKIYRR